MIDKKYQIFISSTYRDLKESRDKIIETVLKLYHLPVGMEMFSADDDEQWEVIKETIDQSDYYIIIIGHRYGSLTKEGISFTEKEYDYAKSIGVPILAFIRNRDVSTKPDEREGDSELNNLLKSFIDKATASKMCDFWVNPDELTTKVSVALSKIFRKNPRVGWVRADQAISNSVIEEMAKLSEDNRKLREELGLIKSRLTTRKPILELSLNGSTDILEIDFDNSFIPIKVFDDKIWSELNNFGKEKGFDINSKNWELPTESKLEEFIKNYELYWRKKNTGVELLIELNNIGKAKANDPFLDISFPKEVTIISEESVEKLEPPLFPIKCLNKFFQNQYSTIVEYLYPFYFSNELIPKPRLEVSRNSNVIHLNKNNRLNEEENRLTFNFDSLLHTLLVHPLEEYKLVPTMKGEYKFDAFIMCEEYEDSIKKEFKLIIKDAS